MTIDEVIAMCHSHSAPQTDLLKQKLPKAKKGAGIVLMFPGQGSQYLQMGRGIYDRSAAFSAAFDECAAEFAALWPGFDLRAVMWGSAADAETFARAVSTQPALFALEFSLGMMLLGWGVRPIAMAGHSIGEYVGAALCGVMSLADACAVVAARAQATDESTQGGAMLSVRISREQAEALVQPRELLSGQAGPKEVWLAAANSPVNQVISGSHEAVAQLEADIVARGERCSRLHVKRAFHSELMQPAAAAVERAAERAILSSPVRPLTSNVSGGWMGEACADPAYWGRHMRGTVRWQENVEALLRWEPAMLLEVGPGEVLCALSRKTAAEKGASVVCLSTLPSPKAAAAGEQDEGTQDERTQDGESAENTDMAFLLATLGKLWSAGVDIDWAALNADIGGGGAASLRRVALPTYSFERSR